MAAHRMIQVGLLVLLAAPALAQDEAVTAREIQEAWVGRALVGSTANGAAAVLKLQSDGSASVSAGNTRDVGTWRLAEQGYCTTWKAIRAGQERCFTVRRSGTRMTVLNPDGSVSGYFTEVK